MEQHLKFEESVVHRVRLSNGRIVDIEHIDRFGRLAMTAEKIIDLAVFYADGYSRALALAEKEGIEDLDGFCDNCRPSSGSSGARYKPQSCELLHAGLNPARQTTRYPSSTVRASDS